MMPLSPATALVSSDIPGTAVPAIGRGGWGDASDPYNRRNSLLPEGLCGTSRFLDEAAQANGVHLGRREVCPRTITQAQTHAARADCDKAFLALSKSWLVSSASRTDKTLRRHERKSHDRL